MLLFYCGMHCCVAQKRNRTVEAARGNGHSATAVGVKLATKVLCPVYRERVVCAAGSTEYKHVFSILCSASFCCGTLLRTCIPLEMSKRYTDSWTVRQWVSTTARGSRTVPEEPVCDSGTKP